MISSDENYVSPGLEPADEFAKRTSRRAVMDQVAEKNQVCRLIIIEQLVKPGLDRLHSPQREQITHRALAQFKSEMQVGNGKPFLFLVI